MNKVEYWDSNRIESCNNGEYFDILWNFYWVHSKFLLWFGLEINLRNLILGLVHSKVTLSSILPIDLFQKLVHLPRFCQWWSKKISKVWKNEGPSGNMNLDCSNNVVYFYVTIIISLLQFTLFLDSSTVLSTVRSTDSLV